MPILTSKINPEDDLGFGPQPVVKNQPLINRDGTPNVKRIGLPFFNTANNYHTLIRMSWTKFWLLIVCAYVIINIIFAFIYTLCGAGSLVGTSGNTAFQHFMGAFFFSAQSLATVAYGHTYPNGTMANSVATVESMLGLLALALTTGLVYGRFSRPSAKIVYSKNILVAPYLENSKGIMFRLANLRRHILIDLEIEIIFSFNETINGKTIRRFYSLEVERRKVSMLTMNWTIVHSLDGDSPLKDMTKEDLENTEASFAILLRAFDDTFSQTVHSRIAYQYHDIVWGAKFKPVFDRDEEGRIVLDLSKISEHELVVNGLQPSIREANY
jgi:inward rectifier potassium channel